MMSKKLVMAVLSVALLSFGASPAFAVGVTFDLTGGAGTIGTGAQPYTVTSGLYTVDLSGYSHSGGASANVPFGSLTGEPLHQDSDGMGVYSSRFDSTQLDAGRFEDDEMMMFDFSSWDNPVRLESVRFSLASFDDEFDLGVDNVDVGVNSIFGNDRISAIGSPGGPGAPALDYLVDLTLGNLIGTTFQFYTTDNSDGYKIASVTVSEVPEPATMGLLGLAALTGVGFRRRKALRA